MPRIYQGGFDAVAVTAVQDLFELNAPSTKSCNVTRCVLYNYTDLGDAQEEVLRLAWVLGYTSSGSGGSAPTPKPVDPGDSAFGGTLECNNTTQASGGTAIQLPYFGWNIRQQYLEVPLPEERLWLSGGSAVARLVLKLLGTPADSITMGGTLWFGEYG